MRAMSRIPSLSGNSSFAVCRLAVADRRPPRTSELTGHCAPVRRRAPERRIRHDVIAAINNRYNRVCADPNLSKLAGEHGGKMAGRHIIQIHYDTGGALARVPRGKTVRQESGQRGAGAGDGEGGRRGGICGGARTRRCQRVLDRTRGRAHLSFRPRGSARPRGSPSRACALRQSTAATRSSTRGCR